MTKSTKRQQEYYNKWNRLLNVGVGIFIFLGACTFVSTMMLGAYLDNHDKNLDFPEVSNVLRIIGLVVYLVIGYLVGLVIWAFRSRYSHPDHWGYRSLDEKTKAFAIGVSLAWPVFLPIALLLYLGYVISRIATYPHRKIDQVVERLMAEPKDSKGAFD